MTSRPNKVNVKLVKYNEDIMPIKKSCHEIDAELSIAINIYLKSQMRQRRLDKYKITSAGNISIYNNAVAVYQKKSYTKSKTKDVLISMFRISKDFVQQNYIIDNEVKTSYYKIVRW